MLRGVSTGKIQDDKPGAACSGKNKCFKNKKRDGGMFKGHRRQHAVALWNDMSSNIKNKNTGL